MAVFGHDDGSPLADLWISKQRYSSHWALSDWDTPGFALTVMKRWAGIFVHSDGGRARFQLLTDGLRSFG